MSDIDLIMAHANAMADDCGETTFRNAFIVGVLKSQLESALLLMDNKQRETFMRMHKMWLQK